MEYYCPVCSKVLTKSGAGGMYYCPRRQMENVPHAVIDSVLYIDDKGCVCSQTIEIPPYIFNIRNCPIEKQNTNVRKVSYDGPLGLAPQTILDIPVAIDLPWHDKEKVMERLKLFILFS